MKVNAAEGCILVQEVQTVGRKHLSDGVGILCLAWKLEARHHARVLIETGAFGESTECAFNGAHTRVKLKIGDTLFVDTGQGEKASIATPLQREDIGANEACNRNDAARGSGLREPRRMFYLLSVCAGHSSSSG